MYGIIREGNKKFYITRILGYYSHTTDKYDCFGRFYIVLNRDRNTLVKVYMFDPDSKPYLDLSVLLMDEDTTGWVLDQNGYGCVDFLADKDLISMVEHNSFEEGIIEKCVQYDIPSSFKDINAVENEVDVERLMFLTGEFHDARISKLEQKEDGSLYVFFTGVWGCDVELFFEGDVSYCTDSRNPERDDPYWYESRVVFSDGYVYFYDDSYAEVKDIDDTYCWFKARKMSYRILPL